VSLNREIFLKYLFLAIIVPAVLASILMSCKVYGQESVRSDIRINAIRLGHTPSDIAVDPSAKYVYVTNVASNTISVLL